VNAEHPKLERELLSQARHVLGGFVQEMQSLAQQADVLPKDFFGRLLERLTGLLSSAAGAVWLRQGPGGPLKLEFQHALRAVPELSSKECAADHARLVEQVAAEGKRVLVPPQASWSGQAVSGNGTGSGARSDPTTLNPTNHLLVLAPLRNHKETVGVIELFQLADRPTAVHRGYLSLVSQVGEIAEEYLKNQSLREVDARGALLAQMDRFSQAAHASLRLADTAYAIANEGRRLLECDRLSVVVARSGKCRVAAISGQDTFDQRSNVVRRLAELVKRVVKSGEALWYAGDRSGLPPQIEEVLDLYLDESNSRVVGIVPLVGREETDDLQEHPGRLKTCRHGPVGALVVEQFRDGQAPDGLRRKVAAIQPVSTSALANAMAYEGHLLAPLSRALERIAVLRHQPWTKIAIAAAAALVLCLTFIPADLRLEGRGALEPVGRHDIFAASDGVVREAKVQHGSIVEPRQVLVELRNTDVEVKLADLQGQWAATSQQLKAVQHTLLAGKVSPAERERLHGQRAQLLETLASLKTQLELYERKREQLLVRSGVAGQVVTWDVENLLKHRPVERGQMLLSVADVDGDWELEVRMPEDRLGHIAAAQAALGQQLPVTFILATQPGVSYQGTLREVHQRAEVRGDEGNVVLVRVAIDRTQLPQLRRGATVIAKVHCGRRALGYVWFHDLWEFVQSRILFRL
jgi:hypothetical protein